MTTNGESPRARLLEILEDDAHYMDTGSYWPEFVPERAVDAILAAGFGDVAAAWDEGVEYAKSQLREMYEHANRPIANEPRPIQNTQVQPCRDAMDSSDGRWGYREYDAHIATARLYGAIDLLTVSAGIEGYEDDDDPNPYRNPEASTE